LLIAEIRMGGGGRLDGSGGAGGLAGIGAAISFSAVSAAIVVGGADVTGADAAVGVVPVVVGESATVFDTLQPASISSKASSRLCNRALTYMGRFSSWVWKMKRGHTGNGVNCQRRDAVAWRPSTGPDGTT
jgi:hypothetical protein